MADIDKRAKFDFIRYANCWEDASVLTSALRIKPGDRCASIASAGDNTLSLLTGEPSLVAAFDLNPAQLACLDIRMAAFRELSHDELLAFLGVRGSRDRIRTYRALSGLLTPESREFWDERTDLVEQGILHTGKFERYFRVFRERIMPLIHGGSMVDRLLEEKRLPERTEFYDRHWNNLRWRVLFRIFFSRRVMGKMGRDPEFFKYVDEDVAGGILKRTEYAFTVLPTHNNPYLHYIFRGNFNEDALPHYLRKEHFNIDKKQYRENYHWCMAILESVQKNFPERVLTPSIYRISSST